MNTKEITNQEIAQLFRKVAAAALILGENRFKIIAYERVADSLEQLTRDAKDYWKEGTLSEIPGVGSSIAGDIDELFKTGKIKHFDAMLGKLPASVFPLLLVPGLGPKKSYKLVAELKLKDEKTVVDDLLAKAQAGKIAPMEGFGEKSQQDIIAAIGTFKKGAIKENRMVLPMADAIAQDVIAHMKKLGTMVKEIDVLGSLRRKVSTIGDIDIAIATIKPAEVIDHFVKYPHKSLTDKGEKGATMLLHNGRQVDLRVQTPDAYGAMLQYFTGSKNHNIHLRTLALEKGLSLNEFGIKHLKTQQTETYPNEQLFYKALGLPWIPPEMREDKGEIEHAQKNTIPRLLELSDMKGDLHIHTSYDIESSHDVGANPLPEYLDKAAALGYEYIGLSDHNPSMLNHNTKQIVDIMKRRKEKYEQLHTSWQKTSKKRVQILLMCEVDILTDGTLALPSDAFEYVDAVIVSLHSSFNQEESVVTKRVVKALTTNPKVRIFGHPTGRLLTKREGADLDWKEIFAVCKQNDIALEINAYPERLDLPDNVVYEAVKQGIHFTIDTDSHAVDQMDMMQYGVSVARRGWATKDDILNTLEYTKFKKWLVKGA
jgi:DNA polymerase (family 10)